MPICKILTNDANIKIKEVIKGKRIIFECEDDGEHYCPYCGSFDLRCKDSYIRNIKNISIGLNATILRIKTYKYVCRDCGHYFCSRPRGLLKHQQSMENFKKEVSAHKVGDEKFIFSIKTVISMMKNALENFKSSKVEEKREIINLLLSNLSLNDGKLSHTTKKPFDKLSNSLNVSNGADRETRSCS